jgi:DDE superfamily endonuclease
MHLPACFAAVILTFAPVFVQQRTWRHAEVLLIGAILAPGKRTVTSLLRIAGLSRERRFTNYHRVLNRAAWEARAAARLLLGLLVAVFAPSGPVLLGSDDTIERRRGKRISAKGIYRDPVRSSKGHFVKASGLRWLSLMLLAPIPWAGRTWALPLLTALAPSERYCRERGRRHKKLTDWARQMALQARRWLPGREIVLLGDSSFAALDLLVTLARQGLTCITRLRLDAALYEPTPPRRPGTVGRPRTKGARLPKLADVLVDGSTCWQRMLVPAWYGERERVVEICSATAVWRHAGLPVLPIRLRRLCRRSLRDRIDAAGIDGCCCAILSAASTRRPCSAPIPPASRYRSCDGSSNAGSWRSPSARCATISALRPSVSGRTVPSPAPRPACSPCSRS